MRRLGLGGAQFGLNYGITNASGQVSENEVSAILALAAENGIDTIDTARAYGTSEDVIGRCSPVSSEFLVVTKTSKWDGATSAGEVIHQLRHGFETSLQALRRDKVDALLVHDPKALLDEFAVPVWDEMENLRRSGFVTKIGASVYDPSEVELILDRFPIDIIQVPLNAIDDRLVRGGQLERLAKAGVEIHARSIFLQGLLLAAPADLPATFAPLRDLISRLDKLYEERGLSRLEGLLGAVLRFEEISRVIVGVTSTAELRAILTAAKRRKFANLGVVALPPVDARLLNAAQWENQF